MPTARRLSPDWTLDPSPWLERSGLRNVCRGDDCGIFHVTTQASALKKSKRFLSRDDLPEGSPLGLGGGPGDRVSTTISLDKALTLREAIRSMSRAIHDQISYPELLLDFLGWTGFPQSPTWQRTFSLLSEERLQRLFRRVAEALAIPAHWYEETEDLMRRQTWVDLISEASGSFSETPRSMYANIQDAENQLQSVGIRSADPSVPDEVCEPIVMFMAKFNDFARIDPEEVQVFQLAARKTASPTKIARECELRFFPEDLRIVSEQ